MIPQLWFTLPYKITLKAGYSYDFGATHARFLRTAVIVEFSAIQVTTAALKTLIALVPVSMVLFGSLLLFFKRKTAPSFLQLLSAVCFLVVVFIHIFEAFRVFPYMNWGRVNSIGHYVDFWSAVLGLVLFPVGYLLHSLTMCRF